jgi:hypothetical protein
MLSKESLKRLQETIDKLEKTYGKGSVMKSNVTMSDEKLKEISERKEMLRLKQFWVDFMYYKQSTELWDKNDFERILENSDSLLGVYYSFIDTGQPYYRGDTDNEKTIQKNKKAIEKLKEIYNKRFQQTEPDDLTKFSHNQKMLLLREIGFLELPIFMTEHTDISQDTKHKLIAKILGCDKRVAKALFNNEAKYMCTPENAERVYKFIQDNKLK